MINHRGRRSADLPLLHRIASILLSYPDERQLAQLDDVVAALLTIRHQPDRDRMSALTDHLRRLPPGEAAQRYVATFDHDRHRTLHLTYYRYGDTRARGAALLAIKETYRRAGHQPPATELPDHLPMVLEFASLAPEAGHRVLLEHRPGLELLRQALHEIRDPYSAVLDALCAGLPRLRPGQRAVRRRLAADGPPDEPVGLAPFDPAGLLSRSEQQTGERR
ncbi:nitrate reductase molybdenum cofactor assembly chaperone [Kitasatospora sp. NPDC001159]